MCGDCVNWHQCSELRADMNIDLNDKLDKLRDKVNELVEIMNELLERIE